jgi:hypothetical protein
MALLQAWSPSEGGSGQTLAWERDRVEQTDPFLSGYTITLSQNPVDANAIIVWSQGMVLDTDDWRFNSPNEIEILFSANPATDTADGVWLFMIQYPYAT